MNNFPKGIFSDNSHSDKNTSKSTCSDSPQVSINGPRRPGKEQFPNITDGKSPRYCHGSFKSKSRRQGSHEDIENSIFCEKIQEVDEQNIEEGSSRRRWIHPRMLFDGEELLQGKKFGINLKLQTDGRSRSNELIKMPKIIERQVEDDTNIDTLMQNNRKLKKEFLLKMDKMDPITLFKNIESPLPRPGSQSTIKTEKSFKHTGLEDKEIIEEEHYSEESVHDRLNLLDCIL